jgi:NTE family protein
MKKIALALGGGSLLGAAHVGVLRAVTELRIPLTMISGTSIGAFIAALYAFGKSWQDIRDIAFDLHWLDLSGLALSQFGLLSNKKFGGMVTELLGQRDIRDALIPLSIVATDIGAGRKMVLSEGDVATAIMASSCIPGIFKPVDYNGVLLVDGMLMENVPVSPLIERGAECVICVDLLASHRFRKPDNIIDLLLNAFYSTITNTTSLQIQEADLCILPELSEFNLVDIGQIPDIMDSGYKAAMSALSDWLNADR